MLSDDQKFQALVLRSLCKLIGEKDLLIGNDLLIRDIQARLKEMEDLDLPSPKMLS